MSEESELHDEEERKPFLVDDETKARFWKKVMKVGDCLIWQAAIQTGGYGEFWYNHKVWLAHRFSYQMEYGVQFFPNEKDLHSCDEPLCVNPLHLRIGSSDENSKEMVAKGRSANGEKHGLAKLTWVMVDNIRAKYEDGVSTKEELAAEYPVCTHQIYMIVTFRSWKKHYIKTENTQKVDQSIGDSDEK